MYARRGENPGCATFSSRYSLRIKLRPVERTVLQINDVDAAPGKSNMADEEQPAPEQLQLAGKTVRNSAHRSHRIRDIIRRQGFVLPNTSKEIFTGLNDIKILLLTGYVIG